jgi:hypothetical protein
VPAPVAGVARGSEPPAKVPVPLADEVVLPLAVVVPRVVLPVPPVLLAPPTLPVVPFPVDRVVPVLPVPEPVVVVAGLAVDVVLGLSVVVVVGVLVFVPVAVAVEPGPFAIAVGTAAARLAHDSSCVGFVLGAFAKGCWRCRAC